MHTGGGLVIVRALMFLFALFAAPVPIATCHRPSCPPAGRGGWQAAPGGRFIVSRAINQPDKPRNVLECAAERRRQAVRLLELWSTKVGLIAHWRPKAVPFFRLISGMNSIQQWARSTKVGVEVFFFFRKGSSLLLRSACALQKKTRRCRTVLVSLPSAQSHPSLMR
jgi:hypothetical protein